MTVSKWGDGGLTITGEHVAIARLITIRSALRLEQKTGMKHSRGSVRNLVRKMDGCPKTMNIDKLCDFLTERIESK